MSADEAQVIAEVSLAVDVERDGDGGSRRRGGDLLPVRELGLLLLLLLLLRLGEFFASASASGSFVSASSLAAVSARDGPLRRTSWRRRPRRGPRYRPLLSVARGDGSEAATEARTRALTGASPRRGATVAPGRRAEGAASALACKR